MIVSGLLVFRDWPPATTLVGAALVVACGIYLALASERAGARSPLQQMEIDKSTNPINYGPPVDVPPWSRK